MKLVLTAFFMAWGMFWIVPCPVKRWDERARIGMLLFLPLYGLLIGAVWSLCALVREQFIPGLPGAALLTAVPFVLSGFIHLDGYMDCADAVLSRRDLETRRKILKDSHVGSFAVVALALLFLLGFSSLAEGGLGKRIWLLPFLCAVPRAFSIGAVLVCRPIPGSSYERMFSGGVSANARIAAGAILLILTALPLFLFGKAGLCVLWGLIGTALTVAYVRHDLDGMSGDVSGAGITVGELCGLLALSLM